MSEKERIDQVIREAGLPGYVDHVEVKLDLDWAGDPGAWVWIIMSDEKAASDSFGKATHEVRDLVWDAFERAGIERRPYVRFRSVSEHAALAGKI